jgi:pSer/pThr/pTyr-binding forkhead associated (FHA) protein
LLAVKSVLIDIWDEVMGKLILSFEGTVLKSVVMDKDRLSIGRKPDNDIQIDSLAVSGSHALIWRDGDDMVLEDLNSTNGTLLNGEPIQKHVLENFDVIELGRHKLKYLANTAAVSPTEPDEPTPLPSITIPSRPVRTAPVALPAFSVFPSIVSPVLPPPMRGGEKTIPIPPLPEAVLQVISGAASGRILDLTKNLTKVGRPGVQVSVITRRPNGYFITHVEGNSFPLLNGNLLGAQATQLNDHDTIEIAGTKMNFFFKH